MEHNNEKRKIFTFIRGGNQPKKSSCCGNFEIEEIPEEDANPKQVKNSCCGNFEVEEIPEVEVKNQGTKNSCCGG